MSWFSNLFKQDDSLLPLAYQWGHERSLMILESFVLCKAICPDLPNKELYCLTLETSLKCPEDVAYEIVDEAADIVEGKIAFNLKLLPNLPTPFGLRNVIKHVLILEEFERFGLKGFPHRRGLSKAFDAVDNLIPENL